MIYKFKSKGAGDVIMLGATGDAILGLLGKEPAAQGIIEVCAMPAAIAAIERSIVQDEAARALAASQTPAPAHSAAATEPITLRQRAWPLVEMMKRARQENSDIVWGV
jgi:hypothetical protein